LDGEFGGSIKDALIVNHKQAISYIRAQREKLIPET
jgi:hypothetical protein